MKTLKCILISLAIGFGTCIADEPAIDSVSRPAFSCEDYPDDPACRLNIEAIRLPAPQLNDYRVFNSVGKEVGVSTGIDAKDAAKNMNLKPGVYVFFGKDKVEYLIK
jgi:hypothetical protein